jgi:hypothetical protein
VAGASNGEDSAHDATPPRGARRRTVRKTFRISAVWQPPPPAEPDAQDRVRGHESTRAAGVSLSDEEVVYGLITARTCFQDQALAAARELVEARALPDARELAAGLVSITLEHVRPARSVAAQIAFVVQVKGNAIAKVAGLAPAVVAAAADALESVYDQPVAVSAVPEPVDGAAAAGIAAPKSGWDRVAPVLAAIGTGVGVIGFVTFIGGVTVYARLRAAGFPAAPALGIFPSQDLVVIGAQTLVPEAISALGAVIVLGLLYAVIRGSQHITVEEEAALLAGYRKHDPRRMLVRARKRLSDEEAALRAGHATAFVVGGMFCFVALALVGSTILFVDELDAKHRWLGLSLVLVAAGLAASVVSVTRRFVYLATTTFVLVGVFLSFTAYWRESNETGVRGAAIIRDNEKRVAGLFVAEGSGRVYIARVSLVDESACKKAGGGVDGCQIIDHRSRLVGISKDEVSDIALGDPKPPWRALEQARHLEHELCNLQVERPTQGC